MKKIVVVALIIFSGITVFAQQVRPLSSAEIFQKLNQLNNLGTVMYIAAHPDDENTRLISYLVHHDHIRTIYLSLTRGDGGQNILGTEQGSALGLIRTYELLEARKVDGAEQLFTPVIDFGFTKSPEETFRFWDKQQLVRNVVDAIQQYKPDIMICRFPTTGEGGHGQHTASAIVASEAYAFIEQYNSDHEGQLFLPKRLLFNAFSFGRANTIKPDQFKVPINHYDPLLGEGYGEMAGRSRSIHKSQGAGTPQSVGISNEHFELLAGAPMENSLYDGIDLSWDRVGRPIIGEKIKAVIREFDFTQPTTVIPELLKIRQLIGNVEDTFFRVQKLKQIDEIILSCAGVMVEAVTDQPEAIPGSTVPLKVNVISRYDQQVSLGDISFSSSKAVSKAIVLKQDSLYQFPFSINIDQNEPLTQPYWLEHPEQGYTFQYDKRHAGLPEAANPLFVHLTINIGGVNFGIRAPVSYKHLDPVRGDVVQRLRIIPLISIEPVDALFIYEDENNKEITVRLKVFKHIDEAEMLILNDGKRISSKKLSRLGQGLDTLITVSVPTRNIVKEGDQVIAFEVLAEGQRFSKTRHLIRYEHIPELQYFTNAEVKAVEKNWEAEVRKIGYVEGVGDFVDDVLKLMGLEVDLIAESEIKNQELLSKYDAIIVGIRALNTKPFLASGMKDLLEYVKNGGNLIVQYNTNMGLVTGDLGPYPITLSRDRVTEEDAKVDIIAPHSNILNFPNKITSKDFDNWVQERGLYFPSRWDRRYQSLFSMYDAGEKPLEGALLYTDYGKGYFAYTSIAFFRQLPYGNSGAIRLMMNLLSMGKDRSKEP